MPATDLGPVPKGPGAGKGWDLLYAILMSAGFPVLLWRRFVRRKDLEGRREKRGYVLDRPPHPQRVWIHAVSMGEALACGVLVKALRKEIPGAEIVFSTTTQTGQEVVRKNYGAEHCFYYPYDFSGCVRRCLDRVKPALVVLMELEVWPNLTAECAARSIPVVVVNGRISDKSFGRYLRFAFLLRPAFRRVRRWLMQTEDYAARAQAIGVEPARVEVSGNIKYDSVDTQPLTPESRAEARAMLGLPADARVILGGSTHPSEETALLAAYQRLSKKIKKLRLVLVPRHPHRHQPVEQEITASGLPCVRRSKIKAQGDAVFAGLHAEDRARAVVLVDTMGELNQLYRAADVAFVGGSLLPHGGQNVMEPAGMGLPTVYGPHMYNFSEAVKILCEVNGGVMVKDADELAAALERLLASPDAANALGARAREAFLKRQGATAKCVGYLKTLVRASSQ